MLVGILQSSIPDVVYDVALCAMISLRFALVLTVSKSFIKFKMKARRCN